MNADQFLQKAKELIEEIDRLTKEIEKEVKDNFGYCNNEALVLCDARNKLRDEIRELLTKIEKGEIEGCGEIEEKVKKQRTGNWACFSCQQKMNEAEKILREVLE